ncbi:MAG TPA: translocation/assembly module TamB domain-containing protein [Hyphomicrobiaceae bacterium]|nr:translocation/assembly module TamB domain-containing protein [Hyphomicrobiaceae bacterium]
MRRLVKWALRLLVIVALIAGVAAGSLATHTGQSALLSLVSWLASDKDQSIAFGSLEGSLLSKGRIASLSVADREGTWLVVHDFAFDWQPWKLLLGQLKVVEVGIARIDVLRTPHGDKSTSDAGGGNGGGVPQLVPVSINRFAISQIAISEPVIGVAARFDLTASAHCDDRARGADARFQLKRLDAEGTALTATLNYRPDEKRLTISANGHEAPGGLIAKAAGLSPSLPLSMNVQGDGILDAWRGSFSLKASEAPFIAGAVSIDRAAQGYGYFAQMEGYLETIAPQRWRAIVSGKTSAQVRGALADNGLISIESLTLANDALRLSGSGQYHERARDLSGKAHIKIARTDGQAVALPVAGDTPLHIASLEGTLDLPSARAAATLATLRLDVRAISDGSASAGQLDVKGQFERTRGHVAAGAFKITGALRELKHQDALIAGAIGETAEFAAHGTLSDGGRLDMQAFNLDLAHGAITGSATLDKGDVKGKVNVRASDLKPLLKIAGIDAAGAASLDAQGVARLDGSALEVSVTGENPSLIISGKSGATRDIGSTKLAFKANRKNGGSLTVRDATITSKSFHANGYAEVDDAKLNVHAEAEVAELAVLSDTLRGSAKLAADITGARSDLRTKILAKAPSLTIAGRDITNVVATLDGTGPLDRHALEANIDAIVTGLKLEAKSRLVLEADAVALDDLTLDWGALSVRGKGRLAQTAPQARFHIEHGNLAQLSALVGSDLAGKLTADVDLATIEGEPSARIKFSSAGISTPGARLVRIEAAARVALQDPLRRTEGTLQVGTIALGQTRIHNAQIALQPGKDGLQIKASAKPDDGAVALESRLQVLDTAIVVLIDGLRAERHGRSLSLPHVATIQLSEGVTTITGLSLQSGDGHLDIDGTVGPDALGINARLSNLPLDLADMIDPSLGARGRLSGTAHVTGTPSDPMVDFETTWASISVRTMADLGLPPLQLRVNGRLAEKALASKLEASGYEDLSITSQVRLGGKSFNALSGTVNGRVPLQIANAILAERGTRLTGAARIDAQLDGTLDQPKLDGTVQIEDASARDPGSGALLKQINGPARISETSLEIVGIRGVGEKGGDVLVRGTISWAPPVVQLQQVEIALNRLIIDDKKQISGEVDGVISINGPITNLLAAGRIDLKRLNVLVPEQMPKSIAALNLKHVNAPKEIAERAKRESKSQSGGGSTAVALQIDIHALERISVKGRGLDALLGGDLKLRGSADAPVADGAFQLVQGRLSLLGRQLEFQRGTVTFAGALEPYLDLEATTEADGAEITVSVTGSASQPEFKFSSQPALPDDEILARLVFNKALVKLTPLQIAQLASEIDKIGGLSSGPGVLDKLKSTIGIDRLDVTTEKDGSTAVSAGSYVGDSTYVGVRQGLDAGSSRIIIDHDLTKNLKARGEVGADGNSKLGVGVEWDY